MKKIFKKEEIFSNRGCYSREQVENLSFIIKEEISLIDVLISEISIKDKRWFLYNKGELTLNQKKELSLKLSWVVLPIFELKYPNDNRVRDCLVAIEDFNNGNITKTSLIEKRDAAYAAATDATYAAADAAYTVADAAYTVSDAADAADAAYTVSDAADAAYADAYAYAYAVADADVEKLSYSQIIINLMIDFVNNNE